MFGHGRFFLEFVGLCLTATLFFFVFDQCLDRGSWVENSLITGSEWTIPRPFA